MSAYSFGIRLPGRAADIRPTVEAALRGQGFGILTEIDVQATFKAKLDLDRPPYLILGACNPPLASRAIAADPSIGTLLPCNVVLREDGSDTIVEVMDPLAALGLVGSSAIDDVAREARQRLEAAIAALEPGS